MKRFIFIPLLGLTMLMNAADVHVKNKTELADAIASATDVFHPKNIILDNDLTAWPGMLVEGCYFVLDLNNNTITSSSTPSVDAAYAMFNLSNSNATFKNGTMVANGDKTSGFDCVINTVDGNGCEIELENITASSAACHYNSSLKHETMNATFNFNGSSFGTITNCNITTQYGACVYSSAADVTITNTKMTQKNAVVITWNGANRPYFSCCVGVSGNGVATVQNSNGTTDGYALYVMNSGGLLKVTGGKFSTNNKNWDVIRLDKSSPKAQLSNVVLEGNVNTNCVGRLNLTDVTLFSSGLNLSQVQQLCDTGTEIEQSGVDNYKIGKGGGEWVKPSIIPKKAYICSIGYYEFRGKKYYCTSGVCNYEDTVRTAKGRDSVIYQLELTATDYLRDEVSAHLCHGDSLLIGCCWRKESGDYNDTIKTPGWCDSVITYHLSVAPYTNRVRDTTICYGQSIDFYGQSLTTSGTYTKTLKDSFDCVTLKDELHLTVSAAPEEYKYSRVIEKGDTVMFFGKEYNTSGTYTHSIPSTITGCDSVRHILELKVCSKETINENKKICFNESYTWEGTTYTKSGVYTKVFKNVCGLDSTRILHLDVQSVAPKIYNYKETIQNGEVYDFFGKKLDKPGNYEHVVPSQAYPNCDSLHYYLTLEWYNQPVPRDPSVPYKLCFQNNIIQLISYPDSSSYVIVSDRNGNVHKKVIIYNQRYQEIDLNELPAGRYSVRAHGEKLEVDVK